MKVKFISYKDLANPEKNPTFCFNPLRAFEDCHKCENFRSAYRQDRVGKLKCKPVLKNSIINLLKKKRYLLDQLAIINALLSV